MKLTDILPKELMEQAKVEIGKFKQHTEQQALDHENILNSVMDIGEVLTKIADRLDGIEKKLETKNDTQ